MSRIRLTIDELVLKGFEPGDRKALVESFEKELSAVLADRAARTKWARSHRTPVLRLGPLPHQASRRLGSAIARGIGKGLAP